MLLSQQHTDFSYLPPVLRYQVDPTDGTSSKLQATPQNFLELLLLLYLHPHPSHLPVSTLQHYSVFDHFWVVLLFCHRLPLG